MDITKSSVEKQTTHCRKRNVTNSITVCATTSLLESYLQDCQQQPTSPASSSSTSQTIGDTTFEPSIDMMINDFDDEQTLTEEEALAELEALDPADEIATLQKESEMPLEELLARYRQHVVQDCQTRPKGRKNIKRKLLRRHSKQQSSSGVDSLTNTGLYFTTIDEVIVIEESDDEGEVMKTERTDIREDGSIQDGQVCEDEEVNEADVEDVLHASEGDSDFTAKAVNFDKRSHLLDLYPETYDSINQKVDDEFSEDGDEDLDFVKKTIMVGSPYQAIIPIGLSKYGDVLPYENEDKLIWESSQVSEQEVEDYLIRVREIKSSTSLTLDDEMFSSSASVASESDQGLGSNLIKDDEQALHLLVQCGYNFKEALRRKRLNAVPLTGSMSLWSEEECRNFEEGIQKFGKDFRKIQQTQVRTRSIRELVQFYYLWKKTDRRDQDFTDSDTIDHMDIYLDFDERDTVSNGSAKQVSSALASECFISSQIFLTKKQHHSTIASALSNFSIMNDSKRLATSSQSKKSSANKKSSNDAINPQKNHAAYRRHSSLLAVNRVHYDGGKNTVFPAKYKSESSASTGWKTWRNHFINTTSATSTISSTSDNHWNKK